MDASGQNPSRRDRIPAQVWNRIIHATERVEASDHGAVGDDSFAPRAPNILLAKNLYTSDLDRYSVVRFSGVQTDPSLSDDATKAFCERPILSIDAPAGGDVAWGISVDPIVTYEIGRIAIGGVVPVQVNVENESHKFAKPKKDEVGALSSASTPAAGAATILWKESGIGSKWALVRFGGGGAGHRLCKTGGAFNKGTMATLDVYEDGEALSESRTGVETVPNVINKYANIGAGKWVSVASHGNGRWYVVAAEC